MFPFPPILTPRLRLRAFQQEDANDLYEYLSDPGVYRFEPGEPLSPQEARKTALAMSMEASFWAIELLRSAPQGNPKRDKVIGQLSFSQISSLEKNTWELGYILSPFYQRQGYAHEAAAALLDFGFREWKIYRVVAHCNPENSASWKLLEKLGFRREAHHIRDNFFNRDANGNPLWIDTLTYAILASEWKSKAMF